MFMFVDGRPIVLTFEAVEQLFFQAFLDEFPEAQVSFTQWRGSYEYQTTYPMIQLMVENGVITRDSLAYVLDSIARVNAAILRPAALHSRVPERFKELGFEATLRAPDASTRGIVAICVDALPEQYDQVATVIRDEMWPAGQHLEGTIEHPSAISNGQPVTIRWSPPQDAEANFKVTITRARGSSYPEDTVDQIIAKFLANYDEQMGIGTDITPATYLTPVDLRWAAAVLVEYDELGGTDWATTPYAAAFDQRFTARLDPANVVIV